MGDPADAAGPVWSGGPADPDDRWRPLAVSSPGPRPPPADRRVPRRRPLRRPGHGPVRLPSGAPSPWSRAGAERDAATAPERCPPGASTDPPRTGEHVDRDEPSFGTARSGRVVLGMAVAVLVVVVTTAIASSWPSAAEVGAPSIPAEVERRWSLSPTADRPAPIVWGRTGVARVVAAEVIVYDLADGALRWRAPIVGADPSIAFLDEAVVVVTTTGQADVTVVGLDPLDGTAMWRRRDDHAIAVPGPGAPVVFDGRRDGVVMRVLDPLTGDDLGEPVEAVRMSTATPYVVSLLGDVLAVLDMRNGTRVGPAVRADGLRSIAPVGDRIVGVSDADEIVLFDTDGVEIDRQRFEQLSAGDASGPVELVGEVPGTTLGLATGGVSVGFDIGGDRIERVWEIDGRVLPPVDTEIGPVAAVRIASDATGHVDHALVDARTGSTIAVTDTGLAEPGTPVIGANGYVVATAVGEGGRTVSAFGFDGDERWHVALPAAASFEVAPGTLLVLEPSGSVSAFS